MWPGSWPLSFSVRLWLFLGCLFFLPFVALSLVLFGSWINAVKQQPNKPI
jgi:hypothetical protein